MIGIGAVAAALALLSLAGTAMADAPVDARVGDLTNRGDGMPTTQVEARRLASANVRQDLVKKRLSGAFELRAAPTAEANASLIVEFGFLQGGRCVGDADASYITPTLEPTGRFRREGRLITLDAPDDEAGFETWNCAFAGLATLDTLASTYDVLVGGLRDIDAKAQLRLGKPALLGERDQPIGLVPGVWSILEVPVFNDGRVAAPRVEISGGGEGVRVEPQMVGKVFAGGQDTARVRVKLTDTGRAKFKLDAKSGAVSASIDVRAESTPAPQRPREGVYESSDGRVSFRVRDGKVVDWVGERLQMRCAPPLEFPTYRTVTLNFPDKEIARSGIVDAQKNFREGDAWYFSTLAMRIAGSKATNGEFTYATAGSCRVSHDFSARRIGD